jgi:hypothetical protein
MDERGNARASSTAEAPAEGVEETEPAAVRGGRRWWLPPWLLGVALLTLGAGAVVLSTAFGAPPVARVVAGNFPVNAGAGNRLDISAHNSPTLARNPVDGSNLAVADRIDEPSYSCALHVSVDGGASWRQEPIPAPRDPRTKCFAPDVAFGADGTLYLYFVTLKGQGNVPNAAWIARSSDGGRTLSDPVRVLDRLAFQGRLAADPQVPGRVYLTWLQASDVGLFRFTELGNPIRFARSDDGGRTWGPAARVSHPSHPRVVAPSLAQGPGGELYVLFLDLGGDSLDYAGAHEGQGGPPYVGPWALRLSRSLDGGTTWEESAVDEGVVPTERFLAFLPPTPSLAVDARSGRLYAGFQDGRLGDPDVRVWSSEDRGANWRGPARVNDTPERDRTSQYLPKLAVGPEGRLDVLYYDRRADRRNVMNEVSLQSSFDGGESFGPRLRLSDRPFSSRIGFGSERDMPDLGSRHGLLSTDSASLAVWTDTRAGTEGSKKQDLSRALVRFTDPPRLAAPLEYGLRYGGTAVGLAGLALLAWALAFRRRGSAAA